VHRGPAASFRARTSSAIASMVSPLLRRRDWLDWFASFGGEDVSGGVGGEEGRWKGGGVGGGGGEGIGQKRFLCFGFFPKPSFDFVWGISLVGFLARRRRSDAARGAAGALPPGGARDEIRVNARLRRDRAGGERSDE
jgi:hypothetical protein